MEQKIKELEDFLSELRSTKKQLPKSRVDVGKPFINGLKKVLKLEPHSKQWEKECKDLLTHHEMMNQIMDNFEVKLDKAIESLQEEINSLKNDQK